MIAGVPVSDEYTLDLARLLFDAGFEDTAEALIVALEAEQEIVALSIEDRDAILGTLIDPPSGLVALRDVLFTEYEGRQGP